jgi:hypothetical protein
VLDHERLCFVNSYGEPLADGWLAKLDAALANPGVGAVGATGSWASNRSWVAYTLRLPSAYTGLLPSRGVARRAFLEMDLERAGTETRTRRASVVSRLRVLPQMPRQILAFERFPAYHLRSNAFMIEAATLARVHWPAIDDKTGAYALESGRASLTRQVQRLGLRTLVVDRDGVAYDPEDWPDSRTLWQGAQEGLLVADNQTRTYERGGDERRRVLSVFAWGPEADPSPRTGPAPT